MSMHGCIMHVCVHMNAQMCAFSHGHVGRGCPLLGLEDRMEREKVK